MIKFRKLVIGPTNVENQIRKYRYEACNRSFKIIPLHVNPMIEGGNDKGQSLLSKQALWSTMIFKTVRGY